MHRFTLTHATVAVLIGVTLFVALLVACNCPVYRDCGFICTNTASQRGYREWCIGVRTGEWYKASALEQFMQDQYASKLDHKWTSYEGTDRNIFGAAIQCGHGRPGPIITLDHRLLALYLDKIDGRQKKALYDLFAGGDEAAINAKVQEITLSAEVSK